MRKLELEREADRYKSALNSDLKDLKVDAKRWGRNSLIIGGSLFAVYKLLSNTLKPEPKPAKTVQGATVIKPKKGSVVVLKIKEQVALFLLALAAKKFKDYLNKKKDNADS